MTQTSGSHFTQPTVSGDTGTWPLALNLNWTLADRNLNSALTVNIPDTDITLTADGTSSDQTIYAGLNFTGALTADRTVTLPSNVKIGFAINATTGGKNVILTAGGATSLTMAPDSVRVRYEVDGSNNVSTPVVSTGAYGNNAHGTYVYQAGGKLKQYGNGTSASGSFNAITFPTNFASTQYVITAVPTNLNTGAAGSWTVQVGTKSVGACQLGVFKDGVAQSGVTFDWCAEAL